MGFTHLSFEIILIQLCSGFPIGLENSAADFHTQFITGLVGVLLIVCGTVFLVGCLCCQRRNGFKEFQNCQVVASSTSSLDHGHINPIANGEFTIFTPLSPPHHNNNVFLANERIVGRTEIDCDNENADLSSWFGKPPSLPFNNFDRCLTDRSEADFPRTKLKYIKEIGRGWFGRVVEGAAQGLDDNCDIWSPVAVRILEASATSTERAVFLHDANIYRCGKHPHILKLLGRCLESVPLLLLQELCPCGDLKKYLLDNRSSAEKLSSSDLPLLWSCQISSAIKHLHDHRLTHPDLAARNCQVVNERTIKLGDYGVAASLYPEDYYQGAPAVPVRWCAPESIVYTCTTIQPKKVTLESNVWSFGVTMWEILEHGAQPYSQLSDDEVISQVVGSGTVRLAKPTSPALYTDYLFRLMQMCWSTLESRPSVSQVHLMLSDLMQVYQNQTNSEPGILLEDFDKRWDSFKPNSLARTDNQDFLRDSKSLADIDLSDITVLNMKMGKDDDLLNSKPMSPSLNNLHGSLDNLVNDEMDSWLQKVAHKTGDMSYVRGLSEAMSDLDKALALENVSSSDSSYQPSPAPETVSTNKLQFQLGPTRMETSQAQQSSLTESMQRTSSESETEDENWRRKIEQGAYSEKVHQKSKSVTDLMVLTHIDYSESDSETPLPSLDYRVNYKNVRYAPKHNLENASLLFGSEGNLLSVHDKFQEELRRLQEERKDSLLFVPEYNRSRDNDTNKPYEDNVVDIDNLLYRTEHISSSNTQSNFTNAEQSPNAISQNTNHRNPEFLLEELSNNTIDIQPANQVYNVFNLTVDTKFTPNHITKDLQNIILLEDKPIKKSLCYNVPKLSEIIQNNDGLMDYIINKYETEEDLNNSKEFNNNTPSKPVENCEVAPPTVNFDVGSNQDEVSPNSMTHMVAFSSTPFAKRDHATSQFSSNFDPDDALALQYSLETWDNFLGEAMEGPKKAIELNGFSAAEPTSLMFTEGGEPATDDDDKTFMIDQPGDATYVKEENDGDENVANQTYDLSFTSSADSAEKDSAPGSGQGWYLHPQENAPVTGELEMCQTGDAESYVGFSVDDEIVAALRNELLMKLPQAQGHVSEQVQDDDEEELEERNEVLIKYYNVPLSPIPEESYSEDSRFICNRRNSTDSENEEWLEQLDDGITPVPDTETVSIQNNESPAHEPPHRHTPSQDSCCSNDTLFNLEELLCADADKKGEVLLRSEKKQETDEHQAKTDNLILDNISDINVEDMCKGIMEDLVSGLVVYENGDTCDNLVNGFSVPENDWLPDITRFLNCERKNHFESNKENGLDEREVDIEDIHFVSNGPEYINVDDLNRLKLDVDYVNVNELDKIVNVNNESDYANVNSDGDVYDALTDIRFTGPGDVQMMSTSFSESVDIDEQDWDSGSDTRSSSSGEFIWKEGEHEESVKALRAAPQDVNSNEKCNAMNDIDEVSTETSDEDEDGDSPEFVPSAWDKYATPTKSSLRSPEKTLEKAEVKSKKRKGVWFKKQKYHCVYEYPREPESPIVNSYDLWQPVTNSLIDWEVDTTSLTDNQNLYLGDFSTGMTGFDDEFYISSTAQPFEALAGLASQFFPGQAISEQWVDLTKSPYENVTPDSGVEDITPASNSDINEFPHETAKPQLQSLKSLATSALKQHQPTHLKTDTTKDCLGGLRHTRNKLKLDLPPSPNAFTVTKAFTIEPEEEPITKQEVPTFTTFGKSRFLVQHVDTPTPEEESKNVSFEALPHKPIRMVKGDKVKVEMRGEASLLDSADEDSGIESSTLERRKIVS
ncbi:hypothetical protein PPYR_12762 [Photinus pyralis]|uniref:Protein kinase domain-containing protein n=1 Tax=Photinus pyralis TaxID=7054 RepID=A0A5N4A750_PHOPY|nr:serine/threonine-protein kinase LMTK2-like isoform X3 [Photinus pyralis]KAB0793142.1 hypothetical protein PPYR_12762 [Photinus pyralis]